MPLIVFKGVQIKQVKQLSTQLITDLSKIIEVPRDYFTLECPQSVYIFDSELVTMYPLIEVKWFDRGIIIQDQVSKCITNQLRDLGYETVEVFFTPLQRENYYENGQAFS